MLSHRLTILIVGLYLAILALGLSRGDDGLLAISVEAAADASGAAVAAREAAEAARDAAQAAQDAAVRLRSIDITLETLTHRVDVMEERL